MPHTVRLFFLTAGGAVLGLLGYVFAFAWKYGDVRDGPDFDHKTRLVCAVAGAVSGVVAELLLRRFGKPEKSLREICRKQRRHT